VEQQDERPLYLWLIILRLSPPARGVNSLYLFCDWIFYREFRNWKLFFQFAPIASNDLYVCLFLSSTDFAVNLDLSHGRSRSISRSSKLVPFDRSYAISYQWLTVTWVIYVTVSEILRQKLHKKLSCCWNSSRCELTIRPVTAVDWLTLYVVSSNMLNCFKNRLMLVWSKSWRFTGTLYITHSLGKTAANIFVLFSSQPSRGLCSHPVWGIFTPWKQLYPPDQAQWTPPEGWCTVYEDMCRAHGCLQITIMYAIGTGLPEEKIFFGYSSGCLYFIYCLSLTQCTLVSHLNLDLPLWHGHPLTGLRLQRSPWWKSLDKPLQPSHGGCYNILQNIAKKIQSADAASTLQTTDGIAMPITEHNVVTFD